MIGGNMGKNTMILTDKASVDDSKALNAFLNGEPPIPNAAQILQDLIQKKGIVKRWSNTDFNNLHYVRSDGATVNLFRVTDVTKAQATEISKALDLIDKWNIARFGKVVERVLGIKLRKRWF